MRENRSSKLRAQRASEKMHHLSRAQRSYGKGHRLALGSLAVARARSRAQRALYKKGMMIICSSLLRFYSALRKIHRFARAARFRKKVPSLLRAARLGKSIVSHAQRALEKCIISLARSALTKIHRFARAARFRKMHHLSRAQRAYEIHRFARAARFRKMHHLSRSQRA
jgi:hypothetical protein